MLGVMSTKGVEYEIIYNHTLHIYCTVQQMALVSGDNLQPLGNAPFHHLITTVVTRHKES